MKIISYIYIYNAILSGDPIMYAMFSYWVLTSNILITGIKWETANIFFMQGHVPTRAKFHF